MKASLCNEFQKKILLTITSRVTTSTRAIATKQQPEQVQRERTATRTRVMATRATLIKATIKNRIYLV